MNILIVIDDYLPLSKKVSAKMMHELAVDMVARGHHVTALVPKAKDEPEITSIDGVSLIRYYAGRIKNAPKVVRLINEVRLSKRALQAFNQYYHEKLDLIVYYSPSIFFSSLVFALKKKYDAKSYLVLRDFFPQWVIDHGMIGKNSLLAKFFRFYERKNYLAADKIGVMSPANLEWFNSYTDHKFECLTEVLYNWVSSNSLKNIAKNENFRRKYALQDKVIFIYGGNIGYAQDMMNIIRLAVNLSIEPLAHIVLIGQGDEFGLVERKITEFGLNNILLLPGLPQEQYFSVQKTADIGLFSLHRDHKTHNFPGKILGYLAQGMPVLGSVNPGNDLLGVINNAGAGFVTVTGEEEQLFQNALILVRNLSEREQMAVKSKHLMGKLFSVEQAVNKILN